MKTQSGHVVNTGGYVPKVGDIVGFICGQPGNDTTYLLVREQVGPERWKCYDLFFRFEIEVSTADLWLASDSERQSIAAEIQAALRGAS